MIASSSDALRHYEQQMRHTQQQFMGRYARADAEMTLALQRQMEKVAFEDNFKDNPPVPEFKREYQGEWYFGDQQPGGESGRIDQ
jgi:hypothetical protein